MNGFYRLMKKKRLFYDVANCYDEVPLSKLLRIYYFLNRPWSTKSIRRHVTKVLLDIRGNWCFYKKPYFKIGVEDFMDMQFLVDFIFENPKLLSDKIPVVKVAFNRFLYSPGEKMRFLRFGGFIKAEKYRELYVKDYDIQYLDRLIAVIYRPAKPFFTRLLERLQVFGMMDDGDIRKKYSEADFEKRVRLVSKLPLEMKQLIWLYYTSCVQEVTSMPSFGSLFAKGEKEEKRSKSRSSASMSWLKIMRSRAGSALDFDKWEQMNWLKVFFDLNELVKEREKLQVKTK